MATTRAQTGEAKCVLLVEDEQDAREALARTLRAEGLTCLCAGSVAEALSVVSSGEFIDVLVVDVVLGSEGPDGIDLIPMLREKNVRAPVVVVTAFADSPRLKRALNLGVSYLIEKPFRAKSLLTVIEKLLDDPFDLAHLVDRALARAGLTEKEDEVARLLLKGLSNEEIASATSNSDKTIRQHVTALYRKVGVTSRAEFFHFVFPT
ncbi:MAG: response regulator transcription factor [Deltaproteobacteria bacterium]|nr:response regulator transcription factor [Deltaproteobacteria bacterium]